MVKSVIIAAIKALGLLIRGAFSRTVTRITMTDSTQWTEGKVLSLAPSFLPINMPAENVTDSIESNRFRSPLCFLFSELRLFGPAISVRKFTCLKRFIWFSAGEGNSRAVRPLHLQLLLPVFCAVHPFALKRCKPNLIEIGRDFRSRAVCDRCNTYQPDIVLGDLPAFPSLLLWGFSETHCNVLSRSMHCKKSHTRVFKKC